MAVGDAEVALRRVGEEAAVLHEEGIVEAESLAQFGALLQGGVLAHHVVDRVADIGEQRDGDEAYRQQDENGLHHPSDDDGDHWSPALPPCPGLARGGMEKAPGQTRPAPFHRITPHATTRLALAT